MSKYDEYYKDKYNCGTVWKNMNKSNDKQPEFSGVAKVDGKMFQVAIWDNGKNLSLKFTDQEEMKKYSKKSEPKTVEEMENDVPF